MNSKMDNDIDLHCLLEAIYMKWGYDFRGYTKTSLNRRVAGFLKESQIESVTELQYCIVRDKRLFSRFIRDVTVNVTEMFRDPMFYKALSELVIPRLKSYPHIKIWLAGCATGEEAYSIAILLAEENLLERATLYATDINNVVLEKAKKGIYSDNFLEGYRENYNASGLKGSFDSYIDKAYEHFIMDAALRKRIVFTEHDLAVDQVFGDMQLILCRNVLIYFDRDLQDRALKILQDSLDYSGYLSLGSKETLDFYNDNQAFKSVDKLNKIYQLVV